MVARTPLTALVHHVWALFRRHHVTRLVLVLSAAFFVATPAEAAKAPVKFLICQPGGPDLAPEQQQVLEQLFRYLERKTGLSATNGSIEGVYTNNWDDCEKQLKRNPNIIFPTLPIYLELNRTLGLTPVAQLRINDRVQDNFYVMVKKDSTLTVEGLEGKTITGTHLGCQAFTEQVALGGKVALGKVKLQPEKLGLRAIRKVMRGKADAVILDGFQYRNLKGTSFGKNLKPIHVSSDVPTPPVAVVTDRMGKGAVADLQNALVNMHKDPEGQSVLKLFRIEGFAAPEANAYGKLQSLLTKAK